jgi:hypothetical protein
MQRTGALVPAALVAALLSVACSRSKHARVPSFVAPPLPAGFVEHNAAGWRVGVPSTWKDVAQKDVAVWASADPQAADEFHAKVFVLTEPFASDSYDYAQASEQGLKKDPHASVEVSRDDVVDGDPTLILETRWPAGPSSAVPYRTMQTSLASRGRGFVVTCAASSSAFERYRSTCESIVRSFAVER